MLRPKPSETRRSRQQNGTIINNKTLQTSLKTDTTFTVAACSSASPDINFQAIATPFTLRQEGIGELLERDVKIKKDFTHVRQRYNDKLMTRVETTLGEMRRLLGQPKSARK